jgi:hypothetical protein
LDVIELIEETDRALVNALLKSSRICSFRASKFERLQNKSMIVYFFSLKMNTIFDQLAF